MTIDIQTLVRREVHYCVSGLIQTLASGYGDAKGALGELAEKAFELSCPIDDWQEAAEQAGWADVTDVARFPACSQFRDSTDGQEWACSGWQELCEEFDIEPYQWEIYEHWIVSDWFARELEKHGERVDHDFDGLTIWGRTTTGQAIYMDSVIEAIYADLQK